MTKKKTMKFVGSTLAIVLATLTSAARAPSEGLSPRQVATLKTVRQAAISPGGDRIAYVLGVPAKDAEEGNRSARTELHVIDLKSGDSRPFITGDVRVESARWIPDGSGIAFLAKRGKDEHTALYVIPVDGGEARKAASLKSDIAGYSFSGDGRRVALLARDPEAESVKEQKKKGFKQEIYEEDFHVQRIWIAKPFAEDDKPRALEVYGSVFSVRWSPASDRLAAAVGPTPLVDDSYMKQGLLVLDAETGVVLSAFERAGKLGDVQWSPDGRHLSALSAADLHDPSAGRLMVAAAEGGAFRELFPVREEDVHDAAWQDADHLIYVGSRGARAVLRKVRLDGSGEKALFEPDAMALASVSLSKDGMHAALIAHAPDHPAELFAMSHGDVAPRRLTTSNPWLADVELAHQEILNFHARDGLALEGILIRPIGEVAGQRYPIVLDVHGGPEAHVSNGWTTRYASPGQMAAARGIAVFAPNYRGSTGRGVAFAKRSQGDPAGAEFDDLVDAVDHLVAVGLADGARVGITGGSYGGYATAWCATRHSARFAAGVMHVGISNKVSKFGTTDIPEEEYNVHALKRVWEDWDFFLDRSPIAHADGASTPLLILHGKDDPRVDPGQSRDLFRHLKLRGSAPVRLVLYPGEGHGNRQAPAQLDYSLRMLQWLEHYLKGPGGEPPPYELEYGERGDADSNNLDPKDADQDSTGALNAR